MSSRQKIYGKGKIEGAFTGVRHEVLDCRAWKKTSPGARLLYIALVRRLSFKACNNGKVYLATRKAADELGASQRVVWLWFKELQHFGFIEMTEPGAIGPKGRATRWRITDMGWGELDGKPIKATKDYLNWTGELFDRRSETEKRRIKVVGPTNKSSHCRRTKVVSPPLSDEQK